MTTADDWESEAENWIAWTRTAGYDSYRLHCDAFFELLPQPISRLAGPGSARQTPAARSEGAEPLSESELRVLRYLPTNLRASEIAAELFVSPNTIRAHVRHVYAKLGVHSRADAVTRARELGLLSPTSLRR